MLPTDHLLSDGLVSLTFDSTSPLSMARLQAFLDPATLPRDVLRIKVGQAISIEGEPGESHMRSSRHRGLSCPNGQGFACPLIVFTFLWCLLIAFT